MSLGKVDIVNNISAKTGLSKIKSSIFLEEFIKILKTSFDDKNVKLSKFGTFYKRLSPQRIGRNPKTKKEFIITKRSSIRFSLSNSIKDYLN
jgi:integration host factor subunit alpha